MRCKSRVGARATEIVLHLLCNLLTPTVHLAGTLSRTLSIRLAFDLSHLFVLDTILNNFFDMLSNAEFSFSSGSRLPQPHVEAERGGLNSNHYNFPLRLLTSACGGEFRFTFYGGQAGSEGDLT